LLKIPSLAEGRLIKATSGIAEYEGLTWQCFEVLEGYGGFWVNSDTLEVGLTRDLKAIERHHQRGVSPPGVTTTGKKKRGVSSRVVKQHFYAVGLMSGCCNEDTRQSGQSGIKPMVHALGRVGACLGDGVWD